METTKRVVVADITMGAKFEKRDIWGWVPRVSFEGCQPRPRVGRIFVRFVSLEPSVLISGVMDHECYKSSYEGILLLHVVGLYMETNSPTIL